MKMRTVADRSKFVWLALFLIGPFTAFGQGTRADYVRAESFLPWNVNRLVLNARVEPHWGGKDDRFWYLRQVPHGKQFMVVDPDQNTVAPAFDQARLAAAISKAAGKAATPTKLPFNTFEFADGGAAIRFALNGHFWSCSVASYVCTQKTISLNPYEVLSPDGKWAAYVHHYNLYVRDVSTGEAIPLTRDGRKDWDYATPLPDSRLLVEQGTEHPRQRPGVFWSPDSTKLVTYRIDSRQVGRYTTVQFVPPHQLRPKVYTYVYPLPGEVLSKAEPIIFDLQSGKRIEVKTSPLELEFQGGAYFAWFRDSQHFWYRFHTRGYKQIDLREVDAATGAERTVISERSDTYVDPGETFMRFIHQGAEVLWSSERDGWNHLYLYQGGTGQLENQVTKGDWVVRRLEYVDAKKRQAYFLASGMEPNEDPYQTHLYRINFDGSGLQLLTPEDANHTVNFSPDGRYFVDDYSRPNLPGESVLRRASNGSIVRVLEHTDASALLKTGWKFPVPFHGKAADGKTEIYGLIWRPSNFNPAAKYPIIEQIYTGPQSFFVPKTFPAAYFGSEQSMAELGFIVVMVDGRGTAGRSRAFHDYSYRNLGNVEADHIALIKQMAAKYPYMDITRVGVYGTSAGGYDAAHAILSHPEFYKVSEAISGNHDQRLDKAWWTELYQGYPVENNYREQSNVTLAKNLRGHLFLVHGDVDDNVNPVETMRLANALMKANKNFDMLFVPNMFHGESGPPYLIAYLVRRRWDYFVRNLLGVRPPVGFAIQPPPARRFP